VRTRDLVKRIKEAADALDAEWVLDRRGGNHDIYKLGGMTVPVPRHREIGERVAEDIFKECADVLGDGWWRQD
jgi:hypothetical protein